MTHATDPAPPDPKQLRTFRLLAQYGKQAAVEAALGKSQSQISRDLSALERRLGDVALFDRESKRVTDAGALLLQYATDTHRGWGRLLQQLQGTATEGTVSLAVGPCLLPVVAPLLSHLLDRVPDLRLPMTVCSAAEASDRLRSGNADVALVCRSAETTDVSTRAWLRGEILAFVPAHHPLARRSAVTARMLRGETCFVALDEGQDAEAVRNALRRTEAEITTVPDRESVAALAANGVGIGLAAVFANIGDGFAREVPPTLRACPTRWSLQTCVAIRRNQPTTGAVPWVAREALRLARAKE